MDRISSVTDFEAALRERGLKYNGSRCQCPAHNGEDLNCAYAPGDEPGKVKVHCLSKQCKSREIFEALTDGDNSRPGDLLFAEYGNEGRLDPFASLRAAGEASLGHSYAVSAYVYYDIDSVPRLGVVRGDGATGKTFRQFHWDGQKWLVGGVERQPVWGLPEILKNGETLYIVEGEKACIAARSVGLNATTNAGGSGAAAKTDWSPLDGRNIVILPDNDEPGLKWASALMDELPSTCTIKVKHLWEEWSMKKGGDIADLPRTEETANRIRAMKAQLFREGSPPKYAGDSASNIWELADVPIDWIVENVFAGDQPTVIGAKQKCLKTTLLVDLVVALTTGTKWLGQFEVGRKRKTLFITGESSDRAVMRTIRKAVLTRGLGRDDVRDLRVEATHFPDMSDQEIVSKFRPIIAQYGIEVVVVDPLYMGLAGVSASNLMEVGPALRAFKEACGDASMVIAHHCRKTSDYQGPPELEHLSMAGISEFAGNYLLIGRLEEYEGDGYHDLAIRFGGRDNQFGKYRLEFDELEWDATFTDWAVYETLKAMEKEEDEELPEGCEWLFDLQTNDDMTQIDQFTVEGVSSAALHAAVKIITGLKSKRARLKRINELELTWHAKEKLWKS